MLFIKRKEEETIIINNDIEIIIKNINSKQVTIGIKCSKENVVLRGEIFDKIKKENNDALNISNNVLNDLIFNKPATN
jgi:carbon storage regulator